ncbi:fasciclin domain-containing protein [Marinicella litoralis]|uniref:Putative surface protein with fasciclin (FAS1) repeats n=1 Tax=Marinicella litoralis TaxID=644220 RepID=A0A4R6Y0W1_9GAMM|nr:fasciclin domain-containing protein [Marinicella litoralis]TDR22568.1 putative surface protein with fasciclin (FAS1) repeats [Marinicella litoralis]
MNNLTSKITAVLMMVLLTLTAYAGGSYKKKADIVDTAVAAGSFNTLVAAVKAAGLVETLKGEGPFTVFAPTDAAFAKLPAGTIENLLKPENKDQLAAILTYHVVSGKVKAKDVVKLTSATTVQGSDVAIMVKDGAVVLNGNSNVVTTDIATSNGVIHVIDTVILPPAS